MKRSVKQWSLEHGYDWFGPGKHGYESYDYKIVFEPGCSAMFKAMPEASRSPARGTTRDGEFLLFPVFSHLTGKQKVSRSQFRAICAWVRSCLDGEVDPFDSAPPP